LEKKTKKIAHPQNFDEDLLHDSRAKAEHYMRMHDNDFQAALRELRKDLKWAMNPITIRRKRRRCIGFFPTIETEKRMYDEDHVDGHQKAEWLAEEREALERHVQTKYVDSAIVTSPVQRQTTLWDRLVALATALYSYAFLLWDGIGFFGFAFYKLPRLRGEKPTLITKFKDPVYVSQYLVVLVGLSYVLYTNLQKNAVGKVQQIVYVSQPNFTFPLEDNLHLVTSVSFWERDIQRKY